MQVKDMKGITDKLPVSLTLPPTRGKLSEIQSKMTDLEKKITIGLPKIAQLIRSYSALLAEVKIAKALSDKAAELISLVPDFGSGYITVFSNDIESKHGSICRIVSQLPILNATEAGELDRELRIIRDIIRDLKGGSQGESKYIKKCFDDISTHYSDVEAVLSRLLEKILRSLDLPGL
jgi:hypothetical protein